MQASLDRLAAHPRIPSALTYTKAWMPWCRPLRGCAWDECSYWDGTERLCGRRRYDL